MNTRHALLLSAAAALLAAPLCANVKVNNIFSDNMVIPRDRPVTVWGTADAGEAVTVTFAGQTVTATADKDGSWEAKPPRSPPRRRTATSPSPARTRSRSRTCSWATYGSAADSPTWNSTSPGA